MTVKVPATKPTSRMTAEQLARVFADAYGVHARKGGWLYDAKGVVIVQGWYSFAKLLQGASVIAVGQGVNWRRVDLLMERSSPRGTIARIARAGR